MEEGSKAPEVSAPKRRHALSPTRLDGKKLVVPAVAHTMANWPEFPKLAEQMKLLIEKLVEIKGRSGVPLDDARKQITAIVKTEVQRRFARRSGGPEAKVMVERAGAAWGRALVAAQEVRDQLGTLYDIDDQTGDYAGPDYVLKLSIRRVRCEAETAGLGSDELSWTGDYSYGDAAGQLKPFGADFDSGDYWPPQGDGEFELVTIALKPGTHMMFKNHHHVVEEDLLDPAAAAFVARVLAAIATIGASIAIDSLAREAKEEVDNGNLPPDGKQAANDAIDEAAEALKDEVEESLNDEGRGLVAQALGPETLQPHPFGAYVDVDWSDISQGPKWQPYLARVPSGTQNTGAGTVHSRWLPITGHQDDGRYHVRVTWEVSALTRAM
jgi:hypothetical protein